MKVISDAEVEDILLKNPTDYIQYLDKRILDIHCGEEVWSKDKIIYSDPFHEHGDIRPMTCFTNHVKIVKVISTNPTRKKHPSVSVGSTLLLDQQENFPITIYDAPAMSGIRTAAMAIWAIDQSDIPPDDILIIGKGRVGTYMETMAREYFKGTYIGTLDTDIETAKRLHYDHDVVVTATNSKQPFITPENCIANLVVSVGADTHFNRELDWAFLKSRSVFVDIPEAELVGDLEHSNVKRTGDMFDLISDNCNPGVFISVGNVLMDALTVEYLVSRGL